MKEDIELKRLGKRTREARMSRKLTIKSLSKKTGVSEWIIGSFERGQFMIGVIDFMCLCDGLNVNPSLLVRPNKRRK